MPKKTLARQLTWSWTTHRAGDGHVGCGSGTRLRENRGAGDGYTWYRQAVSNIIGVLRARTARSRRGDSARGCTHEAAVFPAFPAQSAIVEVDGVEICISGMDNGKRLDAGTVLAAVRRKLASRWSMLGIAGTYS